MSAHLAALGDRLEKLASGPKGDDGTTVAMLCQLAASIAATREQLDMIGSQAAPQTDLAESVAACHAGLVGLDQRFAEIASALPRPPTAGWLMLALGAAAGPRDPSQIEMLAHGLRRVFPN